MPGTNEFVVTAQTLLSVCGMVAIVGSAVAVITKAMSPYKKLKAMVDRHEIQLAETSAGIKDIKESNRVICRALIVLLDHEATGSGEERIKEQKLAMEQFLIDKMD